MKILGMCHGVVFTQRGETDDKHIIINIVTEDDGHWHKGMSFSSFWLDELIKRLQEAQERLNDPEFAAKDSAGFGFDFVNPNRDATPNYVVENGFGDGG